MTHRLDRCCYPNCKNSSDLVYLGKPLCDKHWNMIDTAPALLRRKIGLPIKCEEYVDPDRPVLEPELEIAPPDLPPGAAKALSSLGLKFQQNRRLR